MRRAAALDSHRKRLNFSALSMNTLLGKIVRVPLRFIPKKMILPVLQGDLKGARWIVGSGTNGYWLGSYEMEKQQVFSHLVQPGMVVYDIGANVGFYALLATRRTGMQGRVYAFEPFARNVEFLKRHANLNNVTNLEIIDAAVGAEEGFAAFAVGKSHTQGKLSAAGEVNVRVVTIDSLVARGEIPLPHLMKIDVEGAESTVLTGARDTITASRPTILLATHGADVHAQCLDQLREYGYEVSSVDNQAIEKSSELVARHRTANQPTSA